jgi:hypothetical protein
LGTEDERWIEDKVERGFTVELLARLEEGKVVRRLAKSFDLSFSMRVVLRFDA